MAKPILIGISPNAMADDVRLAFRMLLSPWRWQSGPALLTLKQALADYFQATHVFLVNAGRSGLYLSLKVLRLKPGDEVLLQAFTCVAVPNAIITAGGKPVFVDTVQNDFNLSVDDLERKISSKTKALIIQHTFGRPDEVAAIVKLCRRNKVILIEDCAHALGAEFQGKKVGSFGDMAVLSFGRDKVISSVFGGALITKNQFLAKAINKEFRRLKFPSLWFIKKQLLHPLIFNLVSPFYFSPHYRFSLGKFMVAVFRLFGLISLPVSRLDKLGKSDLPVQKLPNALASLALNQWRQLGSFNLHRKKLAREYYRGLKPLGRHFPLKATAVKPGQIFMRYPILVKEPEKLKAFLSKRGILTGNWYREVVAPAGVDFKAIGYVAGSCVNAEAVSHTVLNLPTHPKVSLDDVGLIIKLIRSYVHH